MVTSKAHTVLPFPTAVFKSSPTPLTTPTDSWRMSNMKEQPYTLKRNPTNPLPLSTPHPPAQSARLTQHIQLHGSLVINLRKQDGNERLLILMHHMPLPLTIHLLSHIMRKKFHPRPIRMVIWTMPDWLI